MTVLQEDRAQASLIHVDGPLSIGRVQSLGELTLYAGEENDFRVSLGTPGEGKASFSFAMPVRAVGIMLPLSEVKRPLDGRAAGEVGKVAGGPNGLRITRDAIKHAAPQVGAAQGIGCHVRSMHHFFGHGGERPKHATFFGQSC